MDPPSPPSSLPLLDLSRPHAFLTPRKRINDGDDVAHFLVSQAYRDIGLFLLQLNRSMCPRRRKPSGTETSAATATGTDAATITTFPILPNQSFPEPITKLQNVLKKLDEYLALAPPDKGPRRFGNVAFRTWLGIVEDRTDELLAECLPPHLFRPRTGRNDGRIEGEVDESETERETSTSADDDPDRDENTLYSELRAYFTGSFGSKQRLDYGTGHELSFLAFLGCLWKLCVFTSSPSPPSHDQEGQISRNIVLGILHPYLQLIRHIIKTYNLEPAGSHGVWGLDDHSFLPYILGSAQLSRPIAADGNEAMSIEGSLDGAPATGDIVKKPIVEKWRNRNLYFAAIGFINDVKTGPFWEHSPILFDISGVRQGWGKINKGMLKMYNAEVLSKFPVVQHFPFGSLFSWDRDPSAVEQRQSVHISAQPQSSSGVPHIGGATAAPWTQTASRAPHGVAGFSSMAGGMGGGGMASVGTAAPWVSASQAATGVSGGAGSGTTAPWAVPSPSGAGIPYSRVAPAPGQPARRAAGGVSKGRPLERGNTENKDDGGSDDHDGGTDNANLSMPLAKDP